ncbi:MAG TPA: hypothetical protein VKU77_04980 [Streptosporangiaceae bacterium]|nr:hypothetical protein [Streptosporangiaceae bacterium]
MASSSKPEHAIVLLPLEDAEPEPLRRWLGREAWLNAPVVSLRYEPDGDRILFRIVDTPSTAWGFFGAGQPPDPDAELFIGFDGTDANAWPTTIALLGFGRQVDQGTAQAAITRELVGNDMWAAALSLREAAGGEDEVKLSSAEAGRLIARWGDLVEASPSDADLDAAVAEWSAALEEGPTADRPARPGSPIPALVSFTALAPVTAGGAAPAPEPGLSPAGSSRYAGRKVEEPQAMARRSAAAPSDDPDGPLRYTLAARLGDIWAAWRDGRVVMPPLPPPGTPPLPRHGITPYMEVRNRHFLYLAERERRRTLTEIQQDKLSRATVRQRIVTADEKAGALRKSVENMPDDPPDLDRRNVVELKADVSLIRARRRREWEARRRGLQDQATQAAEAADRLRSQEAELTEAIALAEQHLDSRVRQLHEHSLRRSATYMRHIVHHHPDGKDVIPYLTLAQPTLPGWLPGTRPDGTDGSGQEGS